MIDNLKRKFYNIFKNNLQKEVSLMEIFDRREDDNKIGGSNMSNVTSPRGT